MKKIFLKNKKTNSEAAENSKKSKKLLKKPKFVEKIFKRKGKKGSYI